MAGLEDAFMKFERGEQHLIEYYNYMVPIISNEDNFGFHIDKQPYEKPEVDARNYWRSYTLYITQVPTIPKYAGVLLGEVIQSFRTSLDYLAWALVTKYSKSRLKEKEKRVVQFPMSRNSDSFQHDVKRLLLNVPSGQHAFFEMYQPYRRSIQGRSIRYLKVLSNTDKHRIIVPAVLFPASSEGNVQPQGCEIVQADLHLKKNREVRHKTKVVTVIVAGNDPNPSVRFNTKLSVVPMFPRTVVQAFGIDPAVHIEPTLKHIQDTCREILAEAKKLF